MIQKDLVQGLPPEIRDDSEVLILGDLPDEKSIGRKKYYSNNLNRFWRVIYEAFGKTYEDFITDNEKLDFLHSHGIALWDLLESGRRTKIRKGCRVKTVIECEVANDFCSFLKKYPNIRVVMINGKNLKKKLDMQNRKITDEYKKIANAFIKQNVQVIYLGSTSGSNGHFEKQHKLEWIYMLRTYSK